MGFHPSIPTKGVLLHCPQGWSAAAQGPAREAVWPLEVHRVLLPISCQIPWRGTVCAQPGWGYASFLSLRAWCVPGLAGWQGRVGVSGKTRGLVEGEWKGAPLPELLGS